MKRYEIKNTRSDARFGAAFGGCAFAALLSGCSNKSEDDADARSAEAKMDALKTQIERVSALADKYEVRELNAKYERNLRTGIILQTEIESETFGPDNLVCPYEDLYRRTRECMLTSKDRKYISNYGVFMNGRYILQGDIPKTENLISFAEMKEIMKYSKEKDLLAELKKSGFRAGDGKYLLLREQTFKRNYFRSGLRSYGEYCYEFFAGVCPLGSVEQHWLAMQTLWVNDIGHVEGNTGNMDLSNA